MIPNGNDSEEDLSDSKEEPELNKQLRILITRLSTSILIFAVIRQSLDHAKHKMQGNNKLAMEDYEQMEDSMGEAATSIDTKT